MAIPGSMSSKQLKVLHVTSRLGRHPCGLGTAVRAMAQGLQRDGVNVQICSTSDSSCGETLGCRAVSASKIPLLNNWDYARGLNREVRELALSCDVIHAHGLWLYPQFVAWCVARALGKPFVVSLHGMLEPERLKISRVRKQCVWKLYAQRMLQDADLILVTSEEEKSAALRVNLSVPIEIVPLGVSSPSLADVERQDSGQLRCCLYLSRITPVKGLDLLIEAVDRLRPEGWFFKIVGSEEGGYGRTLRRIIQEKELERWFVFHAAIGERDKWRELRSADLLVLPSRSENFALVIVEALAMECPVLTTNRTPWSLVDKHGCGWCVDASVNGIVKGLTSALQATPEQLLRMGRNGRQLIERQYTESAMSSKLDKAYEKVLHTRANNGRNNYTLSC